MEAVEIVSEADIISGLIYRISMFDKRTQVRMLPDSSNVWFGIRSISENDTVAIDFPEISANEMTLTEGFQTVISSFRTSMIKSLFLRNCYSWWALPEWSTMSNLPWFTRRYRVY